MKYLPFALILALIGALAVSCRDNRAADAWKTDRDSTLAATQLRTDSAERMLAQAESLRGVAEYRDSLAIRQSFRGEQAYRSAQTLRDSLNALLATLPDTSIPLTMALGAFDSLRVGYDSLLGAFVSLRGAYRDALRANKSLLTAYQMQRESVDSLVQLVGRAPEECRFLTIPCPRAYLGVGVVMADGVIRVGPSLGIGVRIPF